MATLAIVLVAVIVVIIVLAVAAFRVREAQRDGDVRVVEARRDADARAAEAIRDRDWHLATYSFTAADVMTARQQAVTQSRAVVSGKVQEHLAPLFPEFISQFDPREARFIGSPIDYIVFNGLDQGECEVVLVEVKTGRSQLTTRERRIRRAVEAGRIRWVEMRLPEEVSGVPAGQVESTMPTGALQPPSPGPQGGRWHLTSPT
jgi:predicted Holliday junction resolvase-like endonuclease